MSAGSENHAIDRPSYRRVATHGLRFRMPTRLAEIIARNPRFQVIGNLDIGAVVVRNQIPSKIDGTMVNISRSGARLQLAQKVSEGERFLIQLTHVAPDIKLDLPATICWCKQTDASQYDIGCRFDREIGWEVMGELFLNNVIAAADESC